MQARNGYIIIDIVIKDRQTFGLQAEEGTTVKISTRLNDPIAEDFLKEECERKFSEALERFLKRQGDQ